MRCKICGEEKESFQMKTKDICNICAYDKSHAEDFKRTIRKFEGAIRI